MDNKGELTSSQIIGIVIALAGFIIVLLFIAILADDSVNQDDEICRLSVLTRATAPTIVQASVPLKCTTGKICLTESGSKDDCSQFYGEKDVTVIPVKGDDYQKAEIINKVLADEMYQCWSMTGQGNLDIFGKWNYIYGDQGSPSCIICSRVALGKVSTSVREKLDLRGYLESHSPVDGGLTYLKIFSRDSGAQTFAAVNKNLNVTIDKNLILDGKANDQIAFVFSQTKTKDWQTVLQNLGIGGAAFAFTGSQIGAGRLIGAVALSGPGLLIGFATTTAVGFNAYSGQLAAAGYCGEFTTSVDEGLKGGCSIVQAVNYNVQDINKLCQAGIQGNP